MTLEKKLALSCVLCLSVSAGGIAQDVPLRDWMVPADSWSPAGKAVDATGPRLFIGLQPCRILDTRGNGAPITGGIFANSEARNYTITNICGLPAGAEFGLMAGLIRAGKTAK